MERQYLVMAFTHCTCDRDGKQTWGYGGVRGGEVGRGYSVGPGYLWGDK